MTDVFVQTQEIMHLYELPKSIFLFTHSVQLRFLMLTQTLGPSYGLKKIQQVFFHSCILNASPLYAHLTTAQTSSLYHHTLASTTHNEHCYLHYIFATEQSPTSLPLNNHRRNENNFNKCQQRQDTCYSTKQFLQKHPVASTISCILF